MSDVARPCTAAGHRRAFVEGLALALSEHFTVVGVVTRLSRLKEALDVAAPDVVVLDLSFGGTSALPFLAATVAERGEAIRFVVLTAHDSPALEAAAREAGALAFLPKGISRLELCEAIEAALEGRPYATRSPMLGAAQDLGGPFAAFLPTRPARSGMSTPFPPSCFPPLR